MGRPRIIEVNYFMFQKALRDAVDKGYRIDPTEKEKWNAWVKQHRVKEVSFRSYAGGMYEGLEPVIIDADGEWGGFFMFSKSEEAALKWTREPD